MAEDVVDPPPQSREQSSSERVHISLASMAAVLAAPIAAVGTMAGSCSVAGSTPLRGARRGCGVAVVRATKVGVTVRCQATGGGARRARGESRRAEGLTMGVVDESGRAPRRGVVARAAAGTMRLPQADADPFAAGFSPDATWDSFDPLGEERGLITETNILFLSLTSPAAYPQLPVVPPRRVGFCRWCINIRRVNLSRWRATTLGSVPVAQGSSGKMACPTGSGRTGQGEMVWCWRH